MALGLVLNRMQEKCTEWEDSKKKFNQSWQETCLKQRIRWLEQQGSKFKNTDGKQFKPKTLIKEIEDLARAVSCLESCIDYFKFICLLGLRKVNICHIRPRKIVSHMWEGYITFGLGLIVDSQYYHTLGHMSTDNFSKSLSLTAVSIYF